MTARRTTRKRFSPAALETLATAKILSIRRYAVDLTRAKSRATTTELVPV